MAKTKKGKANEAKIPAGLRVLAFEVENVKRVKVARIVPKGNVIQVAGKNGAGKTSLLDALDYVITGITGMAARPIREGENSARASVDLGEFVVTRTWTRTPGGKEPYITKLRIEGKNREVFSTPQALLDSFMGAFTFDPVDFLRLKAKDQVVALRKVAKFSEDIEALERETKEVYDERRIAGREVEAAKARLSGLPQPIEGLPEKPIDTAALTDRLGKASSHNEVVRAKERERTALHEQAQQKAEVATRMREDAHRLLKEAEQLDGMHMGVPTMTENIGEIQRLRAAAEGMEVPALEDTEALTRELQMGQQINAGIRQRDERQKAEKELSEAEGKFGQLDAKHNELSARRKKAIESATMPLEGITADFEEGLVFWKGLPLSQASTAEQMRVSAAMAMAVSPRLRVMHIKDGSLLDDDSMAILSQMAEENDYQVWIERVGGDGSVGIVMEDGEPHGEGVEAIKHPLR